MNEPLVSIITANYNKDKFLSEMLSSIERQSYKNIEHIIIDDGSTDNSKFLIKEYAEKNSFSKIILNQENYANVAKLRNQAVNISTGEYIINIDSDDILYSDAILTMIEIAKQKKSDLVYGSMIYIDKYGNPYKPKQLIGSQYQLGYLIKKMFIPAPRMYKREIFDLTLGYNENLKVADDWNLYLQIEEQTKNINWTGERPLFAYRVFDTSLSNSINKKKFINERNFIKKTALKRRNAKNILLIGRFYDKDLLNELAIKGNNISSYWIKGEQKIELDQFVWGVPYKEKNKYRYGLINNLYKIIKLKKIGKFDCVYFCGQQSLRLLLNFIIFFPFLIFKSLLKRKYHII